MDNDNSKLIETIEDLNAAVRSLTEMVSHAIDAMNKLIEKADEDKPSGDPQLFT